jgi:hypothetical protein
LADDGKSSHKERFRIRAELRAAEGLGKEQKKRGGAAGVYDRNKNYIVPIAAGALGMIPGLNAAVPAMFGAAARGLDREGKSGIGFDLGQAARGAVEGYGAGSVGKFAAGKLGIGAAPVPVPAEAGGALKPLPPPGASAADVLAGAPTGRATIPPIQPVAAGIGGGGGIGGVLRTAAGGAMDWLKKPGNLVDLAAGIHGVTQQQKASDMMDRAVSDDRNRWAAGAPLREAGMTQMLNPAPVDTLSLSRLAAQGNPFALPAAAPVPSPAPGGSPVAGGPARPVPVPVPSAPQPNRGAAPRKRYS